ncbi:MAG: hypothetical protein ACYC7D_03395 [Nitrososphaerales archaeon]
MLFTDAMSDDPNTLIPFGVALSPSIKVDRRTRYISFKISRSIDVTYFSKERRVNKLDISG